MHDPVNHPLHYTSHPARCVCGQGVECIEITEHENFCIGNAMEDLRKAEFYIKREISRLEAINDRPQR